MTLHDPGFSEQHAACTPVAVLAALAQPQAWCVTALRLWRAGPEGQRRLWSDLAFTLGPERGRRVLHGFEQLLALVDAQARRPLANRPEGCAKVGADEAALAHFVATAATGAREDALLMAMVLMRPDTAPLAVSLAQSVGLQVLRGSLGPPPGARPH